MMKFLNGDVVKHKAHDDTVGLVVETVPAYPEEDNCLRNISGNSYQVFWSQSPPGETDLEECWYPEEQIQLAFAKGHSQR